eukprot:scaffold32922_cov79-Isochrysis_galbana.AAC.1
MHAEAVQSGLPSLGGAPPCSVAVVGIGGAGCNALARLPGWLTGASVAGGDAAAVEQVRTFHGRDRP